MNTMGVTSGAGTVYPFEASSGFMLLDQFLLLPPLKLVAMI
jgi:hypothetical protein